MKEIPYVLAYTSAVLIVWLWLLSTWVESFPLSVHWTEAMMFILGFLFLGTLLASLINTTKM